MKEDFIHFLWKYRLFDQAPLYTTQSLPLEIVHPGTPNPDAGPDFSAARVNIDGTLWAGNVEIHVRSSDWYKHGHQNDDRYNNIILHIVMEHDKEIADKSGQRVPVFEVKKFFDMALYYRYEKIIESRAWIPCEKFVGQVDNFIIINWLNRLLVERLENKTKDILQFLKFFNQSWDQTFYYFLARNFGFKVNASPFGHLAQITPFNILARHKNDLTQLEALLYGQAGMLEGDFAEAYPTLLKKEYAFLKHKYSLQPMDGSLWKYAKLRPPNFPTIRIAQFARLIHNSENLFSLITDDFSVTELSEYFETKGSPYWDDHYRFDKPSGKKSKNLGHSAIENILINTIIPFKFVYGQESLRPEVKEHAMNLISSLPPESNSVINQWKNLGIKPQNSGESQALLELKKYYCTPKKCLQCAIGHNLVRTQI
jgi:hypothetical protein